MRCPNCGDNTRRATTKHPDERCVIDTCDVATIRRNNRGQPWAYDTDGRLVYKPNRHPEPTDQDIFIRQSSTADPSHEEAFLARMFGTTGFSIRNRERQP